MSVTINGRRATMEEEKQLAIEMWEFVRLCQLNFYSHDSSMSLKRDFCNMKHKCGIDIEWSDDCFLCEHSCSCFDCPLYRIGGDTDCSRAGSPFDKTMHPENYSHFNINSAINKIIEAIEAYD